MVEKSSGMNQYYYSYQIDGYFFTIAEEDNNITQIIVEHVKLKFEYKETPLIKKTKEELEEYFQGKRTNFDIPLKLLGTDYQNKVWQEMRKIPYGKVLTYQELAEKCGNKKASRAIGNVCHANPILILIPCHRVVASHGIGGFGLGIDMKIKLLELEGVL